MVSHIKLPGQMPRSDVLLPSHVQSCCWDLLSSQGRVSHTNCRELMTSSHVTLKGLVPSQNHLCQAGLQA